MNGIAHILCGGHQNGEHNHGGGRPAVVQSVVHVVVIASEEFGNFRECVAELVPRHGVIGLARWEFKVTAVGK